MSLFGCGQAWAFCVAADVLFANTGNPQYLALNASLVPSGLIDRPWMTATNVAADVVIATSCIAIFVCVRSATSQMRRLPSLRAYLTIPVAFGLYLLLSAATRLLNVVSIWAPAGSFFATVKVLCAAAAAATSFMLLQKTPRIARSLRGFIEASTHAALEREEVENKLLKTQENWRLAFLGIDGVGIWEWDIELGRIFANDTFARFHGFDPALAEQGATFEEFTKMVPSEDLPQIRAEFELALKQHRGFRTEHRVRQTDGSTRWVEARAECKYGQDGSPLRWSGVVIDITARKEGEERLLLTEKQKFEAVEALLASNRRAYVASVEASLALTETNERFRLLVEGVNDHALLTIDSSGIVTSWNRGAERLLGYTENAIVGKNFSCMFTPEDIENGVPEKRINRARSAGRAEDEGWRLRANGERFWASVSKTAFSRENADGTIAEGFAVIIQDTTERKKVATALEEARQERARLQENFLSHVSHELRTPLTAIYFFTSNVVDGIFGELNAEQREHLSFALENVQQLRLMVDDLLDITRVGSPRLTVRPHTVALPDLIADALTTCLNNAQTKGVLLRSECPLDLPFAWADATRVRQILINLIDNAVKFSPEGAEIEVRGRSFAEDPGFLHMSVSDQGCGIAAEHLERIFNRLAQVATRSESSRSGLGLGLFITKELVNQHNGKIWVESEVGKGSVFHFTLPVFSLLSLCSPLFTRTNLERGRITLLSVDLSGYEGAWTDLQPRIHKLIEACIHPAQDILLDLTGDQGTDMTMFIVACTDHRGSVVIAERIEAEIKRFDSAARLRPVINSATLLLPTQPFAERGIEEVMARFERMIRLHLEEKEIPV